MSNLLKRGFVCVDSTKIVAVDYKWDNECESWEVCALLSSGRSVCLACKDENSAVKLSDELVELLHQHERSSVLSAVTEEKSAEPSVRKLTIATQEVED